MIQMIPKTNIWTFWAAQVAKRFKLQPKATIWTFWAAQVAKCTKMAKAAIWIVGAALVAKLSKLVPKTMGFRINSSIGIRILLEPYFGATEPPQLSRHLVPPIKRGFKLKALWE